MTVELQDAGLENFKPGMELEPWKSPLAGAELETIGKEEEREPTEFDYPLRDWEAEFAAASHFIYPLARTVADFVPYAALITFPSARDAYERKSTGGQTLELALEALGFVPAALIGKGIKVTARGVIKIGGLLAKPVTGLLPRALKPLPGAEVLANPFADELMGDLTKYLHKGKVERIVENFGLQKDEAEALLKGQQFVWRPVETVLEPKPVQSYNFSEFYHRTKVDALKEQILSGKRPIVEVRTGDLGEPIATDGLHTLQAYKELGKVPTYNVIGDVTKLSRSGAWIPERTEGLMSLFTKEGKVQEKVLEQVRKWGEPREVQELNHYLHQVDRVFEKVTRGTKYDKYQVFRTGAIRVYGEAGKNLRLDNVGLDELGNIMQDVLQYGTGYRRATDITAWSQIKPVEKVLGAMGKVWGTYEEFFKPVKKLFKTKNTAEAGYIKVWHGMLAGRMFEGKPLLVSTLKKTGEFKLAENYTAKEFKAAGQLASDIGLAQSAGKTVPEIQMLMDAAPTKVQLIAKTLWDWYDHMYAELVNVKIPQFFAETGLTDVGKTELEKLMTQPGGIVEVVNGALKAGNNLDYTAKQLILQKQVFERVRAVTKVTQDGIVENLAWFTDKAQDDLTAKELRSLITRLGKLRKQLTLREGAEKIGFPNYLENYTARLPKESIKPWTSEGGLPDEMHAGFMHPRTVEVPEYETRVDIPSLVGARARMQASELYLYPHVDEYKEFVKGLPVNLKAYSTHWLNRVMGVPSPVDVRTANWIGSHLLKGWDAHRVVEVAKKITDLTYTGGIGFKPFSVMRNYVQPIIMTPAEMGGVKDILYMAPGLKRALNPEFRRFVESTGAIQEYAPDLTFNLRVSNLMRDPIEKLRDFGLWMFKASDRHCRYWSAGAADVKWEHYMQRLGENGIVPRGKLDAFKSRVNLNSQEEWVRKELSDLMDIGTPEGFLEARKLFIRKIADESNFLYGQLESPLIGYTWGSPGRVTLVFQSWWMNYADKLGKWLYRTPEPGGAAISATNERLFTFMLSSAIAYHLMEPLWGGRTAISSVATGPLPLALSIPPTWKPFFDGLQLLSNIVTLPITGDLEALRSRSIQTLKDVAIFVPGGIQTYQMIQGARKEGMEGVLKSIIKLKSEKEED